MSNRQSLRITLAIFGLILGFLFVAGVLRSVLTGETEWWSAIILLPVLLIMYRLYERWVKQADRPE
jgi:Na+-transporting NADH:ubiquinone oxidoreductase subunit NqrB